MQTHPLRRRPARGPGPAHRPPPRQPDQADADSRPAFGSSSTTSAQNAFLASVLCIDTSCSLSNRRWCIRRPPRLCRSPHGGAVPDRRTRQPALHCTSQTGSFAGRRRRLPHGLTLDLPAAGPRHICPPSLGRLTPYCRPGPLLHLQPTQNRLAPPDWIGLWCSQLKAACSLTHMCRGAPYAASPPWPAPAAGLLACFPMRGSPLLAHCLPGCLLPRVLLFSYCCARCSSCVHLQACSPAARAG